jgi:hypothetical protein
MNKALEEALTKKILAVVSVGSSSKRPETKGPAAKFGDGRYGGGFLK